MPIGATKGNHRVSQHSQNGCSMRLMQAWSYAMVRIPECVYSTGHMLSSMEEQWTNEPLGGFQVYKDEGWLSWRDFLGYGEGQLPVGDFLPFEEAREVARAQQMYCQEQVSRTRHRARSS